MEWRLESSDETLDPIGDLRPFYREGRLVGLHNSELSVHAEAEVDGSVRVRLGRHGSPESDIARRVLRAGRDRGTSELSDDGSQVSIAVGGTVLHLGYPDLSMAVTRRYTGECVTHSTTVARDPDSGAVRLVFTRRPERPVLGLGGRISDPDKSGTASDMLAVKAYHQRGDYGGFPIPAFCSPGAFAAVLLNPYPHVYVDLGQENPLEWSLDIPDGPVDLVMSAGKGPQEWITLLHALTGRPPVPRPQWFGAWFSWAGEASADDYRAWVEQFAVQEIPLDVLALDLHWRAGTFFKDEESGDGANLEWDQQRYGTSAGLVTDLQERQIDLVLHVNTRMYSGEVAAEGRSRGYLRDGTHEQWVADLGNPEAEEWAWRQYAQRVSDGAAGWWIDNSERVEGKLPSGVPSRNFYSSMWNQDLTTRTRRLTGQPSYTLTRGGWLGDQTVAIPWPGDTSAGVSRVREDLNFVMNTAMTGFPFSSVDLGGFTEHASSGLGLIDSDENVIRRIAHGFLFVPVPRLHSSVRTDPKLPWRYREPVSELLLTFMRLRHRLAPTFYSAAIDAVERAVPMVRPLIFDYPDDDRVASVWDQVLVGRSLLVAPVADEGWQERSVYLPPGIWHDFWSGAMYAGGRSYVVDAPLYRPEGLPIFVRDGAVLGYRQSGRPREGWTDLTLAPYVSGSEVGADPLVFGDGQDGRLSVGLDARGTIALEAQGADFTVAAVAPEAARDGCPPGPRTVVADGATVHLEPRVEPRSG
ncbi:glycoside hydrolase family 31 protein [Ruania rhizosphaerae]|uniref:glycoside hydrolase family 31 protein n=1 Tax=Ruania rhizosphaerae TaxID=1840413 RepID=UPI001359C91B|nr:TIM-barrel domain-containing protein [Ruania rhizosphaerae]